MTIAKMTIWSLFDGSGLMIERAAEMGHKCYCFNYSEADHGSYLDYRIYGRGIRYRNEFIDLDFVDRAMNGDFGTPDIIYAFPPCTDLAVSGAPAFPRKRARDSYPKLTCLWTGNGFRMPEKKPVFVEKGYSKQYSRLGGKSARTKLIRSLTPRGFAIAVNEENLK